MRLADPRLLVELKQLGVEVRPGERLAEWTSLGIGGTTDLLVVRERRYLPELVQTLRRAGIPFRLLGGGTNLLVADGELPWVVLHLARSEPTVSIAGRRVWLDAAEDLGRAVTTCARANLGGMEGLVGVPGSVGGALRMNAGAYGTEIGSLVRRIELLRMATGTIEQIEQNAVRFGYRASSFAPDDIILGVELELVERPYAEIVELIRAANAKRRASQPLNQKSAGCIFKNPPGLSAGRLIDELGLKGFRVGDAMVSERHANFFINVGRATCAEMLQLIALVRERVYRAYGVELEEEVILWVN
jgi:UDP-N-acetylmuramate dehydrogenase